MKIYLLLVTCVFTNLMIGQKSIVMLNPIDTLLNRDAKNELSLQIGEKDMVFLGESEHHIGSDFLAKTEFVKFLVLEHGYKNIAFEGDFFALYNTNDKNFLFPFWSKSKQCKALFNFLKDQKVTIWGFDNQFSMGYSFHNFSPQLFSFLNENNITYEKKFKDFVDIVCKRGPELEKELSKNDIKYLVENINLILQADIVKQNKLWYQFLQSFQSNILQDTTSKLKAYEIRDNQMASNLQFVAEKLEKQKIIVWAANAHISKMKEEFMDGKIMGAEFLGQTNRKTFHVAFAPIKMPYRKMSFIETQVKQKNNLLNLLPDITGNSIIFSSLISKEYPELKNTKFVGMFGMGNTEFNYFKHFDALVFIGNGEKVSY
ncbi:erythromycin esterase family protein [Flavobacterium granuli]|uniref:Erythromycin esterase n=1 Tax=Flavobacterium granuli TaxID=280093 RepID=A0A1M5NZV2_9FLAO|nr:erythromycin esterase family protein [Flavobacterium granuli]PRZ23455.1 erythromycin esterase [Flavobacterium granuli]SHG94997.1 erythromycin esterase [Flavobacterium granuli]